MTKKIGTPPPPADWNVVQTVTVGAAVDEDADPDVATIRHPVRGGDYGANGVTAADVAVAVADSPPPQAIEPPRTGHGPPAAAASVAPRATVTQSDAPTSMPVPVVLDSRAGWRFLVLSGVMLAVLDMLTTHLRDI